MPNINLMGQNPQQPFDIQTEQARLAQMSQIAQAMITQSMQSSSPIIRTGGGNPFARDIPNFGDPIAKMAQAYFGNQQQNDVTKQQGALAELMQSRKEAALPGILSAQMGRAPPPFDPAQEGPPDPGVAPDIARAIMLAERSRDPSLQAHAANLRKELPGPLDVLKNVQHIDPTSARGFIQTGDPGVLKPPKVANIQDGILTTTQGGEQVGRPVAVKTYQPPGIDKSTGLPGQIQDLTGEFAAKTGGNVSVQNTRENALSQEDMKTLGEGRKSYFENMQTLTNINQIQTDIADMDPAKFGSFAEFRMHANRFAEVLGGKKTDDNAGIEAIKANLGNLMIAKVRALAPVTKEDVKMMNEIIGSEGNTKRALERILDVGAASAARQMKQHRTFVENLSQQPGIDVGMIQRYAPDYNIQSLPPMGGGNPYSKMTDAEILDQLRKGK